MLHLGFELIQRSQPFTYIAYKMLISHQYHAQLLHYVALATKKGVFKPFYSPELLGGRGEHRLHAAILPALI